MTDPEPGSDSRDQYRILMMGHLDGELTADQEREFRAWLERDPEAGRELAQYRRLNDLADGLQIKEPQDYEWDRFWGKVYNRMERRLGMTLVLVGLGILSLAGLVWIVVTPALSLGPRLGLGALALGAVLLFLNVLRGRLRTLPYDRYRGVQR